ncbi:Telomerase protein component 1 [Stygiomarasmius scandens]|uniref:phosphatidylinositol-3,4,5-trisphosphate 3-phosphatase n=1 Tax=Marasmiellus scandens TaxID=2682957 RepID=A0ABR1JU25_9AGAR
MTEYVRRLVSGNKARFKDKHLGLELDLVYLTDQVIIMGYPASGIEGMYRNKREDAKKFLDHRHGKNYWVFNFCPIKENSYPADIFEGRVSRYPFPDHHAPPLAILPLVAREMRLWLEGSPERVAVLHCKAGKGRSGTMACAYLLSLDTEPSAPRLERSYNAKEWAKLRADEAMQVVPEDDKDAIISALEQLPEDPKRESNEDIPQAESPATMNSADKAGLPPTSPKSPSKSFTSSLKGVLDLHTSRRMRAPSADKKPKQGVSIPSQRRWLYYWALLLSHEAPAHLWATKPLVPSPTSSSSILAIPLSETQHRPKVRLTEIKIRLKEMSSMRMNLVKAANTVLEATNMGKGGKDNGSAQVWVSLARYDDKFVELLERWERYTRDDSENGQGNMGRRKAGSDHFGNEVLGEMFKEGKWDTDKMVRSFARMGTLDPNAITKSDDGGHGKIMTYSLRPLSDTKWKNIQEELKKANLSDSDDVISREGIQYDIPASENNSMYDIMHSAKEKGVVLDAAREVRVKLYMGQVFMGWLWFIPTFHMPQPPASTTSTAKLLLSKTEIDFPLGVGSSIIDVEISLEWLKPSDAESVQPPARPSATPQESQLGEGTTGGSEPAGVAATVQSVAAGDFRNVVEATQAAED